MASFVMRTILCCVQALKPGLLVDGEVFFGVVERQLDGDFLAQSNRLAGGLVLIHGQILHCPRQAAARRAGGSNH